MTDFYSTLVDKALNRIYGEDIGPEQPKDTTIGGLGGRPMSELEGTTTAADAAEPDMPVATDAVLNAVNKMKDYTTKPLANITYVPLKAASKEASLRRNTMLDLLLAGEEEGALPDGFAKMYDYGEVEFSALEYLDRLKSDYDRKTKATIDVPMQDKRVMDTVDPQFPMPTSTREPQYVSLEDAPDADIVLDEPAQIETEGLGSRPVAAEELMPLSKGEIREPEFEPPKEEVKEVLFIQKGLTDLGFKPGGIDGAVGGGTRRALRKFQKANGLEVTGIMTPEVFTLIRSGEAVQYPDPPKPDAKVSKISDSNFEVFKEAVAQKESSGRYNIMGGYNNHYVGRYQMGKDALEDEGYSYEKRDALLKDPKKQDELFKKFTLRNHKKLTQNSKKYREMSEKEKLGVLGYAHNQGATAAEEWLYTGVSGKDANGTLGDEYTSLIARYFSLGSKRPKARPDTRIASN